MDSGSRLTWHSDTAGWAGAAYLPTIMAADIDGNGKPELLARGPGGIKIWAYDDSAHSGTRCPMVPRSRTPQDGIRSSTTTPFSAPIEQPQRGKARRRGADGLHVWKYAPPKKTWFQLAMLRDLSDANGWGKPEYYSTSTASTSSWTIRRKCSRAARTEFEVGLRRLNARGLRSHSPFGRQSAVA